MVLRLSVIFEEIIIVILGNEIFQKSNNDTT